jgi:hypothetical protein
MKIALKRRTEYQVEMHMKAKYVVGLLLVQAVALCACSPQKSLAHRLNGADRVIYAKNHEDFSISVTGDEVKKIVQALASGKKESPLIAASPECRLEFFKGAKHLAAITNSVSVFWIGQTPYSDRTGTLKTLRQRLRVEGRPKTP